ncbi:hypothetical protein ABK040_003100 [Willaertia magna]
MDPLEQFKLITNANDHVAKFYIESANGDLEAAITNYFNTGGNMSSVDENSMEDEEQQQQSYNTSGQFSTLPTGFSGGGRTLGGDNTGSTTASSNYNQPKSTTSSTKKSSSSSSSGGIKTFKSIREEEDVSDKDNRYYAGSGQQIVGANDQNKRNTNNNENDEDDIAEKIFKKAQEKGAKTPGEFEAEERRNQPKFSGVGRRVGETEDDNVIIPSTEKKKEEKTVTITFFKDGFSIDDGELRQYDDPKNREFLEAIDKGYVPREVAGTAEEVVVNLINKKTENWSPPPKVFKSFEGSGKSLGGSSSSSSSIAIKEPPKFEVDPNKPTTSLQIRMADGTRLVGKFNTTHTVGDIRNFIKKSIVKPVAFDIMTNFPNKVLTNDSETIEQAGLKGATILQKLK